MVDSIEELRQSTEYRKAGKEAARRTVVYGLEGNGGARASQSIRT